MELDGVRLQLDGPVATLTLSRPDRRNALSLEMLQNIIKGFEAVPPEAGVVVLGAEGKAFSAGHDMSEMIDRPADYYSELFGTSRDGDHSRNFPAGHRQGPGRRHRRGVPARRLL